MNFKPVTKIGMIKQGDLLLLREKGKDEVFPVTAKIVMTGMGGSEEVVFSKRMNRYFNVNMMLSGDSWIAECAIIENGRAYSVINTTEVLQYG